MKNIMIYCHVFFPENSGYSNAFQNLVNAILDNYVDVEVTVVTPYKLHEGSKELERDRLNVIRLGAKSNIRVVRFFINEYFYAKKTSKIFLDGNYDFILVETFDQAIFLNSLDPRVYKRLAVRVHATNETEYTFFAGGFRNWFRKNIILKFLSKKINWILSTNSYHICFVKKYFYKDNAVLIGDKNFFVLPNPVSVDPPFNLAVGDKIRVFCLGRMDYLGNNQKGFTDIIFALKLLPETIREKFEFKLVGKGDMRQSLISLSNDFSGIEFVESMDHDDVIKNLKESDVVVLPSRYEGLSMFALEALATGNVCIFSKTGGLIDMIEGNGIHFNPQDIDSLVSSLIQVSASSSEALEKMKHSSLSLCEERFSSQVVAKRFKDIYDLVVKGGQ